MSYFERKLYKKCNKLRRNYEIDEILYRELVRLTKIYDASLADLINISIEYLIKTDNVRLYEKDINENSVSHTMLVREPNVVGLEKLKEKYGISISKLVNIAIKNALAEE